MGPIRGLDAGAWKERWPRCSRNCEHGRRSEASPREDAPDTDPRKVLAKTITYLDNNHDRMRYPEYRQAGMPVTTAWMESLVKEVDYRVKGTEMFWNNPEGAEAILQVRAAALCDDERFDKHLARQVRDVPSLVDLNHPNCRPKKSKADVHPAVGMHASFCN